MKSSLSKKLTVAMAVAVATFAAVNASAAIRITEVDPSGSSKSYAGDWFELTNTGTSAVDITGWKMDDNSNGIPSTLEVALHGVTSIAAGQSVVFIEDTNLTTGQTDATLDAAFSAAWFGSNVPAGLTIGNYGGSGVGLSATSDAVNIFDATGGLVTRVDFGAAAAGTFDNTAGLDNVTLTQKSVAGVNGAFASVTGGEIGSPGVAPVPEPESYGLMLGGFGLLGFIARRRKSVVR